MPATSSGRRGYARRWLPQERPADRLPRLARLADELRGAAGIERSAREGRRAARRQREHEPLRSLRLEDQARGARTEPVGIDLVLADIEEHAVRLAAPRD